MWCQKRLSSYMQGRNDYPPSVFSPSFRFKGKKLPVRMLVVRCIPRIILTIEIHHVRMSCQGSNPLHEAVQTTLLVRRALINGSRRCFHTLELILTTAVLPIESISIAFWSSRSDLHWSSTETPWKRTSEICVRSSFRSASGLASCCVAKSSGSSTRSVACASRMRRRHTSWRDVRDA